MKKRVLLLLLVSSLCSGLVFAKSMEDVKAELLKARPGLPIQSIVESPVKGMYQIELTGGQHLYVSDDAGHFFAGDLYKIADSEFINLTDYGRNAKRKLLLDKMDETEMVVFAPETVKKTITVFTDFDCTYCRKLHQEVPALNELGIAVRYLAFPRAGISSASYNKMVSAWCADDQKAALTAAKAGMEIEDKTCANPVAKQFNLGSEFGVTGTPAIILEDGELVPGYMPAQAMAARLGIN